MNKVCPKCGKESEASVAFCTQCGEKLPDKALDTPPQPTVEPKPDTASAVNDGKAQKAAGTGAFFGLMALFALPVIGFIACIVMCFVPKNKSLRNFSRAVLIWYIIGIVILGLLVLTGYLLSGIIMEYIQGVTGMDLSSAGEAFSGFSELSELSDMMSQLATEGIETVPAQ